MPSKQRVLVTGATGTLGTALVTALTIARHEVVANFCRDEERAFRLKSETGCQLMRGDVSVEADVQRLFDESVDAVFHLAGVSRDAILPRLSHADWGEHLKTNLQGAFLVTRASLQTLPHGGRLVLVSSRVGERGFAGQSAYGASKAAVLGLMRTAASEGKERGIKVNAICPGFAPSAMSQGLSSAVLAAREAQNWIPNSNAAESFVAMCLYLLESNGSGRILRPDCRI